MNCLREVKDLINYNNYQKHLMSIYLEVKRKNGDVREKNVILIEWIQMYSERFRNIWCDIQDS